MPALASCRISTKSTPALRSSSISTSTSPPGSPNTRSIPAAASARAVAAATVSAIGRVLCRADTVAVLQPDPLLSFLLQRLERLLVDRQVWLLAVLDVLERDFPVGDRVLRVAKRGVAAGEPDVGDELLFRMTLAVHPEDRHRFVLVAGGDERRAVLMDAHHRR